MDFTGRFIGVNKDWQSGEWRITFSVNEERAVTSNVDMIKDCEKLAITAKKYRQKRSKDANALLWHCIGKIAACLRADKWDIYLQMLKRYGQYTYIVVKPNMVEKYKKMWRECEEIGEIDIHGESGVQLLCYFGSSTYDTKEFSVLLDGVISEMEEMGLETPLSSEMERALQLWEERNQ